MKTRKIYGCELLNPAYLRDSNICYVLFRPEKINTKQYFSMYKSIDEVILAIKKEKCPVQVEFPVDRGMLFDAKKTFQYCALTEDEVCKIQPKLRAYEKT